MRGLDAIGTSLHAWQQGPQQQRPEALVIVSFDTELPSGHASESRTPPMVGDRLRGIYEVAAVFGVPVGVVPERTLPVRPTVTLLLRIGG